ncbi:MAG: cytochrome bc complex cytochrome b subunit [Candidatus Methylomirabilales bacterium]
MTGESWTSRFWRAIDQRLGLDSLRYEVPAYGNTLPYILGGLTFFALVIIGLTGIYLAQFYHPHPSLANASVQFIITSVFFGEFARNLHYWAAQAIMVLIILHVTRVFLTGAYKKPREFNWIVGVGLLATSIGLYFTGTVLKWDQEAFEALEHNIEISELLGVLGSFLSPGFAESVPLLTRLFTAHVSLLPLVFLGLFALHVFYVRYFGIAPVSKRVQARLINRDKAKGSFSQHAIKILLYGALLFLILAILAMAFGAPLGPEPIEGVEVTKPPWPFLWLFPIESTLGIAWLLPASVTPILLLLLAPFLDRGEERDPGKRKLFVIAFLVGIGAILALTLIAAFMPTGQHLGI